MNRSLSALLLGVILLGVSATTARADACFNDNDPRTSGTPIACNDAAACPNPGVDDDATHYLGGDIVYTPAQSLGACHPGAPDTYSNGCTVAAASCISGQCVVQYEALMYRPSGPPTRKPAVLLVPGSTVCKMIGSRCVYQPEKFCGIKTALLAKGYVVMEALPRGYGTDATHGSTGYYIDDRIAEQHAMGAACVATPGACSTYDLIDEGLFDVTAAYNYLANRPFVDATAIGVLGHSLGGIRALGFNREDHGQKATITLAPASESWCFANGSGNTVLWDEMKNSVDLARSPIYTFQPRNDVNLESGSTIAHEAAENRLEYQAAVFPAVMQNGNVLKFGNEAHACFVTNHRNVVEWAPTVINFLRRYGVK